MKILNANILRNERGGALVITLWVTLILCVIAIELAYTTRLELRTLDYGRRRLQSEELARSAVEAAIAEISDATRKGGQPLVRLADGKWQPPAGASPEDTPVNKISDANGSEAGSFSVEIIDESGKLNVNTVDEPALAGLFKLMPLPDAAQLAHSIIAYRASRPGAIILSLDELINRSGVTERILYGEDTNNNGALDPNENDGDKTEPKDNSNGKLETGIAAHLSASPKQQPVSLNLAPEPVIAAALGVSADEAKEFIQMRTENRGVASFESLKAMSWITDEKLQDIKTRFSLSPARFTVRASAAAADGGPRTEITAYVSIEDGKTSAFLWREKQL